MACHHVDFGNGQTATICGPDAFVSLEPFGAKVWVAWHNYLGPSFYRSEKAVTEIRVPSKKTWDAFERWRSTTQPEPPQ